MPVDAELFQNKLIHHCAPTFISLKVGSLFLINKNEINHYKECINYYNQILNEHHLSLTIMKNNDQHLLIYLYNHHKLKKLLEDQSIQKYLNQYGYPLHSIPETLGILKNRLLSTNFPHEIGIFLGYPLYDVKHFNSSKKEKIIGYWKVYGNKKNAQKTFYKFDCCKKMMINKITNGYTLEQLMLSI